MTDTTQLPPTLRERLQDIASADDLGGKYVGGAFVRQDDSRLTALGLARIVGRRIRITDAGREALT